jgi:ribosomal protein L11 methyltransferase
VPYRIDLRAGAEAAFDRLVELGAIDAEISSDHSRIAALMPDAVAPERVAAAIGAAEFSVSPAVGRDADSVWVLNPRAIHVGRLWIVPAHLATTPGALRLIDHPAFGTGLHPTTALCLEALEEAVDHTRPESVLDVGTGSGVLALAALMLGVPRAHGIDMDEEALRAAAENARLNSLDGRFTLTRGGPEAVTGTWPLIVANLLAGALIEMAPALVRRVGPRGQLVLSGIRQSVSPDVSEVYRRTGMRAIRQESRAGWGVLVLQASW